MSATKQADREPREWWATPGFAVGMMLLAAIPLLLPALPPMTDAMGHMARFRVAMDLHRSADLARHYDFHWAVVGNLGVDLLILPVAKLFGLELGTKLIVLTIPPLTVGGMLLIAREAHGRVPPTALFALPLAYGWPVQFGFLNFILGMALALPAIGLWMRLGRLGHVRWRAGVFVPIALVVWISHTVAWGLMGLVIFAIEMTAARGGGASWRDALRRSIGLCLPLAPPALLMLDWWGNRSSGRTAGFLDLPFKLYHVLAILRSASIWFDVGCAGLLYALLYFGLRGQGLRFERRLGIAAAAMGVAFLAMPMVGMGAAYADMRLAPYAVAIGLVALTPLSEDPRIRRAIALAGLLLFGARIAYQATVNWRIDRHYTDQLAALDHVPHGARVFTMVAIDCMDNWREARTEHIDGMAVVRREALTNGQWPMPGGRLLGVRGLPAGFDYDPSQVLRPERCRSDGATLAWTIRHLPRAAFDYVWLVDVPPARWPRDKGLVPVWRGTNGALFRIAA